jgi:hypothetical protein
MLYDIPFYISLVFILTSLTTLVLFTQAIRKAAYKQRSVSPKYITGIIISWLFMQSMLSISGFYDDNMTLPPGFTLAFIPPMLTIILLFIFKSGRKFIDSLPLSTLTWLQTVRVPVEIVLYWLMLEKTIPQLMTFEGRNFDILAGITAPFAAYFGFVKNKLNNKILLIWNIVCLGLVLNIVVNAIFSLETPFQKFAFDQPNVAVLKFPFVWLPSVIVPIVIFSHLVSMRRLIKSGKGG